MRISSVDESSFRKVIFPRWGPRKVPALGGREWKTNLGICVVLVLEGPLTIYEANKEVKGRYPTTFRTMKRLEKSGYIEKIGTKKMEKKEARTQTYGTTWRGFIVALLYPTVRKKIATALCTQRWLVSELSPFHPTEHDFMELFDLLGIDERIVGVIYKNLIVVLPNVESIESDNRYFRDYIHSALTLSVPELQDFAAPNLKVSLQESLLEYTVRHPQTLEYWEEKVYKPRLESVEQDFQILQLERKWLDEAKAQTKKAKQ